MQYMHFWLFQYIKNISIVHIVKLKENLYPLVT